MTHYVHDPTRLDFGSWRIVGPPRLENHSTVVPVECKGCGLKAVRVLSKLRNGYSLQCRACSTEQRRTYGHLPAPHRAVRGGS